MARRLHRRDTHRWDRITRRAERRDAAARRLHRQAA